MLLETFVRRCSAWDTTGLRTGEHVTLCGRMPSGAYVFAVTAWIRAATLSYDVRLRRTTGAALRQVYLAFNESVGGRPASSVSFKVDTRLRLTIAGTPVARIVVERALDQLMKYAVQLDEHLASADAELAKVGYREAPPAADDDDEDDGNDEGWEFPQ